MGKIFSAKKIITMERDLPFATHLAVEGDRIVGVGGEELLKNFPGFSVDDQFSSSVILPGFVEGHAHLLAGQDGMAPYVGYFDRPSPEGKTLKGLKSMTEVIAYLQEVNSNTSGDGPIFAIGFDPIYFDGPRPTRLDLDKVSTSRMVVIYHASGHMVTANTFTTAKIPQDKTSMPGFQKDEKGQLTGEIHEIQAMMVLFALLGSDFQKFLDPRVLYPRYAKLAQSAGVTTITEMGVSISLDDEKSVDALLELSQNSPIRLVPMYFVPMSTKKPEEIPGYVRSLIQKNTDKLRFGHIKMMADGSIQGYTARLKAPYINGVQNGLWNQDPESMKMFMKILNAQKLQVNCHCNGDEASEAFIAAVEDALKESPWADNRHTVQHAQMMDDAQFQRAKSLGMTVNIFTNHIYYWGDQHEAKTVGPERANKMDAANTARRLGVPFSLHCDASVTPIAPLFNIWTAVNRMTASGKVFGPEYKITVEDGFYAMTMGTAYLLRLENEIGSLKIGKKADLVVLAEDPYATDPLKIKDIQVLATVLGGEKTN